MATVYRVRELLGGHSCYDILPISSQLIALDMALPLTKGLAVLLQNGMNCAPLWNNQEGKFAGLLTVEDFVRLVHHYYSLPAITAETAMFEVSTLTIHSIQEKIILRNLAEQKIDPFESVLTATVQLLHTGLDTVALVSKDQHTRLDNPVGLLSRHKILRFIAQNCDQQGTFRETIVQARIGTFTNLATAHLTTPVVEAASVLATQGFTALPVVDEQGLVVNVFEQSDIMNLLLAGLFGELAMPIRDAFKYRPETYSGVLTCKADETVENLLRLFKQHSETHRFVVVDDAGKLVGMVTLQDLLIYFVQS